MVPRIDQSELAALAAAWGFDPSAEEAGELLAVAEAVFSTLDLLETQEPTLPAPVEAVREPGRRPSSEEDPLNAIVRLCRVRARGLRGDPLGKAHRDEGLGRDRRRAAHVRLGHPPGLRAAATTRP